MGPSVLNFQCNFRESGSSPEAMPRSAGPPRNIGQLVAISEEGMYTGFSSLPAVPADIGLCFIAVARIPQEIPIAISSRTTLDTDFILNAAGIRVRS